MAAAAIVATSAAQADRFTFLSLGEVIGAATKHDLEGEEIRKLMAGGAELADLAQELAV